MRLTCKKRKTVHVHIAHMQNSDAFVSSVCRGLLVEHKLIRVNKWNMHLGEYWRVCSVELLSREGRVGDKMEIQSKMGVGLSLRCMKSQCTRHTYTRVPHTYCSPI